MGTSLSSGEGPEFFDAVVTDESGWVREIQVKQKRASSRWIWGAFRMPDAILHELHFDVVRTQRMNTSGRS